jgi:hypothetical protein
MWIRIVLMRIRIQLKTLMRIRIQIQIWGGGGRSAKNVHPPGKILGTPLSVGYTPRLQLLCDFVSIKDNTCSTSKVHVLGFSL